MVNLVRANRELFRRTPDETFSSLKELHDHCRQERHYSSDYWQRPQLLMPSTGGGDATAHSRTASEVRGRFLPRLGAGL